MPVKVIAIAGTAHCGSTILDTVLGGIPGAFSAGEVRYLWERGLIERQFCGCSQRLPDCELWPKILQRAFPTGIDPHITAAQMRYVRTRFTLAARTRAMQRWYHRKLQPSIEVLDMLYPAIAAETEARFIIDSSKAPNYIYLLSRVPSIDLRIVHLIRDPRAVAHSWSRPGSQGDTAAPRLMGSSGLLRAAVDWNLWNTSIRSMFTNVPGAYVLLRYEDFVAAPEASMLRILVMAGERDATFEHLRGRVVELAPNHTVSGNPTRFRTGTVDLKLDDAWHRDMRTSHRRIVESATAPLRKSFGYVE